MRFGIDRASVAAASQIFGPVTVGFARKLVLLPAGMVAELPVADLHTVIAHEFAHMRRNDFLKNLIYELLSLPVSYHPLFSLTRERIMESREMVCDEMAAEIAGRNEYARSLLRLATLLVNGLPVRTPHAIGIFDANAFERRLMKLTEKQRGLRGLQRLALVAACAVFGVGICGSALALSLHVDTASAVLDHNPPNPAGPIHVSAEVMAGNRLSGPNPKYPVAAKKAKIQGEVVLDALIGKDGTVEHLTVVSGPKELQQSSLDAVSQWIYKPFLLNGDPIEVKTTVHVIYSLAK
jgi:TonB family protein